MKRALRQTTLIAGAAGLMALASSGCSTFKSAMAIEQPSLRQAPIQNPFGGSMGGNGQNGGGHDNVVLRTKKGDRSIEVELPANQGQMTDFVVPVSPQFLEDGGSRSPASSMGSSVDERYAAKDATLTDRELTRSFPQGKQEDLGDRRDVETGLGLSPSDEDIPLQDKSYLGAVDHVKQLYRNARYEAALLEIDELLRLYPTDPKLYEMRGTLLDRTGRPELAIRSWNQAVQLEPSNASLKKFVERKQYQRNLANNPSRPQVERMPASTPAANVPATPPSGGAP